MKKHLTYRSEHGTVLLLAAFFAAVLLGMCALAIGLGFVSGAQVQLQNTANAASLGAIEAFHSATGGIDERKSAAVDQVNEIFHGNKFLGSSSEWSVGHGIELRFGRWDRTDTGSTADPCPAIGKKAPCFIENSAPRADGSDVDAVLVRAKSTESGLIYTPFARLFGDEAIGIHADAYANSFSRCTAFLFDISLSASLETHKGQISLGSGTNGNPVISYPPNPSLFAFRENQIPASCASTAGLTEEQMIWCSMPATRPAPVPSGANGPSQHYRSDYQSAVAQVGNSKIPVLIDTFVREPSYSGAQPLGYFMHAMNAALITFMQGAAPQDRVVMIPFNGNIVNPFPETGVTDKFEYLIQLTNVNNRGTRSFQDASGSTPAGYITSSPELHPNFVDMGWIPLLDGNPITTGTNIPLALRTGMNTLNNSCAPGARKQMVLFSDGMTSCSDETDCDNEWYTNYNAESKILRLIPELAKSQISVSVILDGQHVKPHYLNIFQDGRYLEPEDATRLGYVGCEELFGDDAYANIRTSLHGFFDCSTGQWDYLHLFDQPGYVYTRANGIMGQLAMKTGGQMRPLLSFPDNYLGKDVDPRYYDHDNDPATPRKLRDSARDTAECSNRRQSDIKCQTHATWELTKPEQARETILETIGRNRFLLVTE